MAGLILLQTTIPTDPDDWAIARFSLLRAYLQSLTDPEQNALFEVIARDRVTDAEGHDPILSSLDQSDVDQLWLFAVDSGEGLSAADCEGIQRFRQRGGGLLTTRDHQDLGSSLCKLTGTCHAIGSAHFFHTMNPEPDPERQQRDDQETTDITWPNYHSGRNGDYQQIQPTDPVHEVLKRLDGKPLQYLPAHPHEGAVGIPVNGESSARVIATGVSQVTNRPFNVAIAFEKATDQSGHHLGRAWAESTFHHFCDYNWDPAMGCPSFVSEDPGDGMVTDPEAINDVHVYVRNLAVWLAG